MKFIFLLIFILVPLAEIAVFIQVGEVIGLLATIALVILTAVIGVALLKRQGVTAIARAQEAVNRGDLPVDSVIDGVCLLVAGAFLLTPGLITDTAGFLLLVPPLRYAMAHWLFRKIKESGSFEIHTFGTGGPSGDPRSGPDPNPPGGASGPVIEGDFEDVSPERTTNGADREEGPRTKPNPDSPWRN